jgi:hypothetical protein
MARKIPKSPQKAYSKKIYLNQANIPNRAAILNDPETVFALPISWNFHMMDSKGEWACGFQPLLGYLGRLPHFERRTIRDVFVTGDRHSHPMSTQKISKKAQDRLNALNIDVETIYQLSLDQKCRLWGILEYNIFNILWLDVNHTVCVSNK